MRTDFEVHSNLLQIFTGRPLVQEWRLDEHNHRVQNAAGSLMLAPKALQASVRTVRSQPAVQWILELDPSSSQELLNGKKFEPLPQLNFRDPQAVRLVQLLQTEVEKGSRTGGLFGETVGNSLILYLAEHYPTATTGLLGNVYAAQENGQGYASILVDEITIYAHLELDVVLAELSDEE